MNSKSQLKRLNVQNGRPMMEGVESREEFKKHWSDTYGTTIDRSDVEFVGFAEAAWDAAWNMAWQAQQVKINYLEKTQPKWISVDNPPELNVYVWIYTSKGEQYKAKRIEDDSFLIDSLAYINNVTHWQPLPAPPEEDES